MEPILTIRGEVRGGGHGRGAWVAKIVGPHPKFGLERQFVNSEKHLSRSAKSGFIDFKIYEAGIYEVRGLQKSKDEASIGTLWNAFIEVKEDGSFEEVSKPVF